MEERLLEKITELVKNAYIEACISLPEEVKKIFLDCLKTEDSLIGKSVFEVLLENAEVARRERIPLCQDTGVAVVWVKAGYQLDLSGVEDAINKGISLACKEGYLRASVCDPLTRKNTGDNTPAIVHYEFVKDPILEITVVPKGCGSENMSRLKMLSPSVGIEGIKKFVVETVKQAGPNPCPPLVVGVGIGGNFETSALLSKKALFRLPGEPNPDPELNKLEEELKEEINALGIGPLGFKGKTTCLAVHIEKAPCHIASLPVAVNLQCHCIRIKKVKVI